MSFSDKLYKLRISKGISQKELADNLGVAQSSINYWEKGQRDPSITVVKKIAEYFGVSLDYLMEIDDNHAVSGAEFSDLVQKYRVLDADGKETVDFILNKEYKRCAVDYLIRTKDGIEHTVEETQKRQSADRVSAYLNAAHALKDATKEDKQHDENMMDDEDF